MLRNKLTDYFNKSFIEKKDITGVRLKDRFYSKKNKVWRLDITFGGIKSIPFILKEYAKEKGSKNRENEVFFYGALAGTSINVPFIFYSGSSFLIMQFIGARTLLSCVDSNERSFMGPRGSCPIIDTCKYINDFNKRLKMITGKSYILNDMNLRNFLPADGKIYRVDLEDCTEGAVEQDFGRFIAFFLTYDPQYSTWKRSKAAEIKKYLRHSLALDLDKVELETQKEITRMEKRRKMAPIRFLR